MWQKAIVAYFKAITCYLNILTEEIHKKLRVTPSMLPWIVSITFTQRVTFMTAVLARLKLQRLGTLCVPYRILVKQ
jgi:hypothetical protein